MREEAPLEIVTPGEAVAAVLSSAHADRSKEADTCTDRIHALADKFASMELPEHEAERVRYFTLQLQVAIRALELLT